MNHRFATCLLPAAVLMGCESSSGPSGLPAITGPIVERDRSTSIGGPPTVHVKETVDEECGIIFVIRSPVRIQRRAPNGSVMNASLSDLTVGRRVAVWADAIAESCPAQAAALAVEIRD